MKKNMAFLLFFFAFNIHGLEFSYLCESIEILIIRETAKGNLEQKLTSLEYIEDAVKRGTAYINEIIRVLEFLYVDAIENNRDADGFNQVREKTAMCLGYITTEEARRILLFILQNDDNENVLAAALESLGKIANDGNGD
jgi:hypothetical protein